MKTLLEARLLEHTFANGDPRPGGGAGERRAMAPPTTIRGSTSNESRTTMVGDDL
jgi:hypothetical protein